MPPAVGNTMTMHPFPERRRPRPVRHYEPTILRNPFEWMGIWTPDGWRTHKKRFGAAQRELLHLNGDGARSRFPGAMIDPCLQSVAWSDDLHLKNDPFTDGGIYPCDPRVEYPIGRPRWAVSHTLLCYPVADHSLYTHEYTWDMQSGALATHFRHHVPLEECRTDSVTGKTVRVSRAPISQAIEGNVHYSIPNSAVRGVWTNPEKRGKNLYTRRVVQCLPMLNGVYVQTPFQPVVQCHGVWETFPEDPLQELFEPETGMCSDAERVIRDLQVPLDEPKLAMFLPRLTSVPSLLYNGTISAPAERLVCIDRTRYDHVRRRLGERFREGQVGYAAGHPSIASGGGYFAEFDFNDNGTIDEQDLAIVETHLGRVVRSNLYVHAYFGPDWLSICVALDVEHRPGRLVIADYTYGAGYDAASGTVDLFETPGPDQPVWVEYHHDAPAEAGEANIGLHIYRES